MSEMLIQDTSLTAIADAIRAKTGTTDTYSLSQMPTAIASIQGGGEAPRQEAVWKFANFCDYTGFNLYSYTKEEVQAMTELPPLPQHETLIAQEWNITLSELKAQKYRTVIGPSMTTDNGDTIITVEIDRDGTVFDLSFTRPATIDWGDGTPPQSYLHNTTLTAEAHTYNAGNYKIRFKPSATLSNSLKVGTEANADRPMRAAITEVNVGTNVAIYQYGFNCCAGLKRLSLPNTLTDLDASYAVRNCFALTFVALPRQVSVGQYTFYGCYAMRHISMPSLKNVGNRTPSYPLPTYVFYNCHGLRIAPIPENTMTIGNYAFRYCYALEEAYIPPDVASIGTSAFQYCYGIKRVYLAPTTPPTLQSTSFSDIHSSAVFYVPYSQGHSAWIAYQSATNWSALASKMREFDFNTWTDMGVPDGN